MPIQTQIVTKDSFSERSFYIEYNEQTANPTTINDDIIIPDLNSIHICFYTNPNISIINGHLNFSMYYAYTESNTWTRHNGYVITNTSLDRGFIHKILDIREAMVELALPPLLPEFEIYEVLPPKLCKCGILMLQYKKEQYCPKCEG